MLMLWSGNLDVKSEINVHRNVITLEMYSVRIMSFLPGLIWGFEFNMAATSAYFEYE